MLVVLLALAACTPEEGDGAGGVVFVLPATSLGAPVAASYGFDPADGDGVGRALDATLPVFGGDAPLWDTPAFVWELAMRETIRNAGVCPAEQIDGSARTYLGDCRSSFGYEYIGEATEDAWTEGDVTYDRLDAELQVLGDVDGAEFERAVLSGAIVRAVPSDGRVDAHYDVNLRLALAGYWSRRGGDDPRELTWSDWAIAGTAEVRDGRWLTDLAVEIAGAGGMRLRSDSLALGTRCPIEAEGEADLGDDVTALFSSASCDACADVTHPDGEALACRPD